MLHKSQRNKPCSCCDKVLFYSKGWFKFPLLTGWTPMLLRNKWFGLFKYVEIKQLCMKEHTRWQKAVCLWLNYTDCFPKENPLGKIWFNSVNNRDTRLRDKEPDITRAIQKSTKLFVNAPQNFKKSLTSRPKRKSGVSKTWKSFSDTSVLLECMWVPYETCQADGFKQLHHITFKISYLSCLKHTRAARLQMLAYYRAALGDGGLIAWGCAAYTDAWNGSSRSGLPVGWITFKNSSSFSCIYAST